MVVQKCQHMKASFILFQVGWNLIIYFVFFSAGGIGVLQNVDRVSNLISEYVNKKIDVRGLVDSAWVLDIPAVPGCVNCNPNLVFEKAIK